MTVEDLSEETLLGGVECKLVIELRIPCHQMTVVDVNRTAAVKINGTHGTEAAYGHFARSTRADHEKAARVAQKGAPEALSLRIELHVFGACQIGSVCNHVLALPRL